MFAANSPVSGPAAKRYLVRRAAAGHRAVTCKVDTSDYRFTHRQVTNGVIRFTLAKTVSGTTTSMQDVDLTGVAHKAEDDCDALAVTIGIDNPLLT